jgi:hypothetical protein
MAVGYVASSFAGDTSTNSSPAGPITNNGSTGDWLVGFLSDWGSSTGLNTSNPGTADWTYLNGGSNINQQSGTNIGGNVYGAVQEKDGDTDTSDQWSAISGNYHVAGVAAFSGAGQPTVYAALEREDTGQNDNVRIPAFNVADSGSMAFLKVSGYASSVSSSLSGWTNIGSEDANFTQFFYKAVSSNQSEAAFSGESDVNAWSSTVVVIPPAGGDTIDVGALAMSAAFPNPQVNGALETGALDLDPVLPNPQVNGHISMGALAPTVTVPNPQLNGQIIPGAFNPTVTVPNPTVLNATVFAGALSPAVALPNPQVNGHISIGALNPTATFPNPTVTGGISMGALALALALPNPQVNGHVSIGALNPTVALPNVTVFAGIGAGALAFITTLPNPQLNGQIIPSAFSPTVVFPNPTVTGTISMGALALALALPNPQLNGQIVPGVFNPTVTFPNPQVNGHIVMGALSPTVVFPNPTVSASGGVDIDMGALAFALALPNPQLNGQVIPGVFNPTVTVPNVTVNGHVSIGALSPTVALPNPQLNGQIVVGVLALDPILPNPSVSAAVDIDMGALAFALAFPAFALIAEVTGTIVVTLDDFVTTADTLGLYTVGARIDPNIRAHRLALPPMPTIEERPLRQFLNMSRVLNQDAFNRLAADFAALLADAKDLATVVNTNASTVNQIALGHSGIETIADELYDSTEAVAIATNLGTPFYMPWNATLTGVSASIGTAASTGVTTFDVNKNGVTMLSTKLTIDATENHSKDAATPAVISVSALLQGDVVSFDVDAAGTGANGPAIVYLELERL